MKKENGITLIALIITIIILIILTAITINNIMSADLFGLTRKAVEDYIKAGKEEENVLNEIMSVANGIGNGGEEEGGGTAPQETLRVELKVDEEKVTGAEIPIELETLSGESKVQDVTYKVYLKPEGEAEQEEIPVTSNTYKFTELDEEKDYTIRASALSNDGRQAETTITIKALAIKYQTSYSVFQMVYRRYTDGMTWRAWVESSYDHSVDKETVLSMVVPLSDGLLSQPNHSSCLGVEGATWVAGYTDKLSWQNRCRMVRERSQSVPAVVPATGLKK